MINDYSLNSGWMQPPKSQAWAPRVRGLASRLTAHWGSSRLPREFVVDEEPNLLLADTCSHTPLILEEILRLMRAGCLYESPVAPALCRTAGLDTTLLPVTPPTTVMQFPVVRNDDMTQLLRESESLVDSHEEVLSPLMVSRANRLMLELRDALATDNRVTVHVRGRELARLVARLRSDLAPRPEAELDQTLACVGA